MSIDESLGTTINIRVMKRRDWENLKKQTESIRKRAIQVSLSLMLRRRVKGVPGQDLLFCLQAPKSERVITALTVKLRRAHGQYL